MVYNGSSWEELTANANLYIDCFTITQNGVPYGIAGEDLYTYQNDSWLLSNELLFVSCPITSIEDTLYLSLSEGRGVIEYDTLTNQYSIISVINKNNEIVIF
jgi:hypothetical protein